MAGLNEQFEQRVRQIAAEEVGRLSGVFQQQVDQAVQRALGEMFGGQPKVAPAAKTVQQPQAAAKRQRGRPRKVPRPAEPPQAVPVAGASVVEAKS